MQLPGRLRLTTLGDVLGALHRSRATGVLELMECAGIRAGVLHRVHIDRGLVHWVELHPSASAASSVRALPASELRRRLEVLFRLPDARLSFRVARARLQVVGRPLQPVEFLAGRPRARDLSVHVLPSRGPRRKDPVRERALGTLGLSDDADPGSIQRAFRKLAREWHPDRHPAATAGQRAELLRRFAELSAAYHTLVA